MADGSGKCGSGTALDGYVYAFADAQGAGPDILGGKGAGLARMSALGMPIPPGFTVTTRTAREFRHTGSLPDEARKAIEQHLTVLETQMSRSLGAKDSPLLVSVRSGAPVSMPGMMDTVLNVGLNGDTVAALAGETGDENFAWACYERFLESYARIVRGIGADAIEDKLFDLEGDAGPRGTALALLDLVESENGTPIPVDPREQVFEAIAAVFNSWESPRAQSYRQFRGIDDELCTAATVQAMVFGNRGEQSASGVAFTRDPSSGEPMLFGDILFNAQGEDVVSGDHDALPLQSLVERMPEVATQLRTELRATEHETGDLCEVEFTIEQGVLWILQTRVGQRSGRAAVRVAVDLVDEGIISIDSALRRVTAGQLESAARPGFEEGLDPAAVIGSGLAACPGAASGRLVFDASRATQMAARGEDVILLRPTTSPNDVAGFIAARAIVTGRGGRTSHAAVVARGMHRPAVCGIGEVRVSADRLTAQVAGMELREGDEASVDGDRGIFFLGRRNLMPSMLDKTVERFVEWCDQQVRVPRLQPEDVSGMPVINDLTSLESATQTVVLDLRDPRRISSSRLAEALSGTVPHPPVLRPTEAWLCASDTVITGTVAGILAPPDSISISLLLAVLTSNE